jgi:hypothetical protein
MKRPYCHKQIATVDFADSAFILRTLCEKCGKEFLIVDGVPVTEEQYSPHPVPARKARRN